MKKVIILLMMLGLLRHLAFAQNKQIDSLQKENSGPVHRDTIQLKIFDALYNEYKKISEYAKALDYADKGLMLAQKMNYKTEEAICYSDIGLINEYQSNYPDALKNYLNALKIYEQLNNKKGIGSSYESIGVVNKYLGNYNEALKNFNLSLEIRIGIKDKPGIASAYNNIADMFQAQKNNDDALRNYFAALNIYKEINVKEGIAATTENIGNVYNGQGKYEEALEYTFKALKIKEEIGDKYAISVSYDNLAGDFLNQKNYQQAVLYAKEALLLAIEISANDVVEDAYKTLAEIYAEQHNYELAYENHVLFKQMNDIIFNQEKNKQINDLKTNDAVEKKSIELKAQAEAERKKQNLIILFVGLGLLLVLVFAGFIFRSLRIRNKQNKIIVEQKKVVEIKNKEITQSIEYALRIQTAILPSQKIVKQYLENSFILYKPKDIVAGDFYWMESKGFENLKMSQFEDRNKEANEHHQIFKSSNHPIILFAACDCTGHGVPGAMVSVVCHNALNRAVREFGLTQPAAILDKTAEIVIENFSKSEESIKDGMDISLCSYNSQTKELQWSGANNPLLLIKNNELIETKADKQPIGMNENSKPFTNHSLKLNTGDSIYLFTDGFADQFGGETGQKKLTKKRFKNLILSIQNKSMQEQGFALDKFITEYRNEVEQIDDILVMGVKV